MTLSQRYLTAYNACKQTHSPEYCRQMVIQNIPAMMKVYLMAYDGCLRVLPDKACRNILAPEGGFSYWPLAAGLAIGFVLGRVFR